MAGKKLINESPGSKSSDGIGHSADPTATGNGPAQRGADTSFGSEETYAMTTKSGVLNAIMSKYADLSKDALHDVYKGLNSPNNSGWRGADTKSGENGQLHQSPSEAKPITTGADGAAANAGKDAPTNGAPKNSRPGAGENSLIYTSPTAVKPVHAKEDIEDIFAGEELTEELKEKAIVVFEAAINARLISEVARLEEEAEVRLEETIENIRIEMTENVDKYLSYAVEQWVEENAVAIDTGLRNEMAEEFILGLKNIFEANYIEIPESKVDVVSEMVEKIEELETRLNEEIEKNLALQESNTSLEVNEIFESLSEDLAKTQVEKLRVLAEGITYSSPEEYTKKVNIIKETYFKPASSASVETMLNEEIDLENDEVQPTGPMAVYMNTVSKTVKR